MDNRIYKFIAPLLLCAGLLTSACKDIAEEEHLDNSPRAGYLTLKLGIVGSVDTRGSAESDGEDTADTYVLLNENKLSTLDLFFYAENASRDDAALMHSHTARLDGNKVDIPIGGDFAELIKAGQTTFKIYAVVNWHDIDLSEVANPGHPSFNELKAATTMAAAKNETGDNPRAFRADVAPNDFVMTNLHLFEDKTPYVTFETTDGKPLASTAISLRRVAAKIRLALDVRDEITDGDVTWKADKEEIRLFISNGVRKARLDGNASETELTYAEDHAASDYYNIQTSGSTQTDDYAFSRRLTVHTTDILGETPAENATEKYTLYNTVPYYTYPNTSNEALLEPHQTMLTFVVPWRGSDDTYKPTYYTVPVKNGDIVSNAYYCLRAHVGMMGSSTPERPLQLEVQSEIAEWGSALDTDADIRELRILQCNKTEYTLNNTRFMSLSYTTTHTCALESVEVTYYKQTETGRVDGTFQYGNEQPVTATYKYSDRNQSATEISDNTIARTFTCTLYNETNTITFDHDFNKSGEYSRYDVVITFRHSDVGADSEFTEKIYLHTYPAIYVTSENIDVIPGANGKSHGAFRDNDGWILINGYGYQYKRNTGNLGRVTSHAGDTGDTHNITTFTVTQLNDAEKDEYGWIIDDPRTYYVHNLADDEYYTETISGNSYQRYISDDTYNHFDTWTDYGGYGGPYDGTKASGGTDSNSNRWQNAEYDVRTIWEWYTGEDWFINYTDENGNAAVWSAKNDKKRKLRYYYPASSDKERELVIAPKFSIVSIHAYDAESNDDGLMLASRRCAAYQQLGYPAGRWRLPTRGEILFVKELQRDGKILDVFGGSRNWCATGVVDTDGEIITGPNRNNGYTRCVYDNWYWERYDSNGNSLVKIPEGTTTVDASRGDSGPTTTATVNNWTIFTWGDRPKENVLTRSASGRSTEVERFLEEWQGIH